MMRDPLLGYYEAKCTTDGCPGTAKLRVSTSTGWKAGTRVPYDPSVPEFGKCHLCKCHSLEITKAPAADVVKKPVGFDKIPST